MYVYPGGSTDALIEVMLRDTSGNAVPSLTYASGGNSCYYNRPRAAGIEIPLVTQTVTGVHDDGGFVEIDGTNMPGLYRLDLPDAAVASGENWVTVHIMFTATEPTAVVVILDPHPQVVSFTVEPYSLNSGTAFMTDLPSATNDFYNESFALFKEGPNSGGGPREVTDFEGSTGIITVAPTFTSTPANGNEGILVRF